MIKTKNRQKAFTLVELLVVIVIIGLLASIVAPKFFGKLDNAKIQTARAQISLISTALDTFNLDVGRYPTKEEGLKSLWKNPNNIKNWNGKYLPKPIKEDPWGYQYFYGDSTNDNEYELKSFAADNKAGGDGKNKDISIWE